MNLMFSNHKKLILFIILLFQNCLPYLFHLGQGQLEIIKNRNEISEVLEDQKLDDSTKEKLRLVLQVREFAIKKLALNPEGGYKYFTKLDRPEVGWHVSASYPLKFDSYTWWFPIAGKVPYKGYFDIEKAKEEEKELKEKGLDTKLRITAGYSTLGWFSDPLLSPQLKLKKYDLVSLVIHEMTHATVYFKNDSVFNESFATFVEEIGTEIYFNSGETPEEKELLKNYKDSKRKNKKIISEIKNTALQLKSLYDSDKSDSVKLLEKEKIIEKFRNKLLDIGKEYPSFNKTKWLKSELNNENFIGAL
ncbi:MAG: aminopeptidase, partial [Leptospiraceae bacterium]|nr:aminopeptidase [Leptospiraceae bacterium]